MLKNLSPRLSIRRLWQRIFPRKSWAHGLDFLNQLGSSKDGNHVTDWQAKYLTPEKNGSIIPFFPVLPANPNPKPFVELYKSNGLNLGSLLQPDAPLIRSPRDKTIPLVYKQEKGQEDFLEDGIFELLYSETKDMHGQKAPLDLLKDATAQPETSMTCLEQSMQRQLLAFADNAACESRKNIPFALKNDVTASKESVRSLPTGKERAKKMPRERPGFYIYRNVYRNSQKKRTYVLSKRERIEQRRKRMRITSKEEILNLAKDTKLHDPPTTPKRKVEEQSCSEDMKVVSFLPSSKPKAEQQSCSEDMKVVSLSPTSKPKVEKQNCSENMKVISLSPTSKPKVQKQSYSENMKVISLSPTPKLKVEQHSCSEDMKVASFLPTSNPKVEKKSYSENMKVVYVSPTSKPKVGQQSCNESIRFVSVSPTLKPTAEQQNTKVVPASVTSKPQGDQQSCSKDTKVVSLSSMTKSKKNSYNTRKFHALKFLKQLFGEQNPVTTLRSLIRSENCLNCVINQSLQEDQRKFKRTSERRIATLEKKNIELSLQLTLKTKEAERWQAEAAAAKRKTSSETLSNSELDTMFHFLHEAEEINCLLDDALRVSLETNKAFLSKKQQTEPVVTRDIAISCEDVETEDPDDDSYTGGWVVKSPRLVVRLQSAIEKRECTLRNLQDKIENLGSQISLYEENIKELRVAMKDQRSSTKASHLEVLKLRRQNDILNESRKHMSTLTISGTSKAFVEKFKPVEASTAEKATQGAPSTASAGQQAEPLPACPSGPKFENWKAFRRHLKTQISSGMCSVCAMTFSPNVDRRLIEEHITFHMQFDI
ncbi:uncharacterized protein LOC121385480 [Gigantopelta aegis]|uniref:uncharacterized protein LOC121385480 n=1 Tax=Gigantopelta aegis TaxID=1735272 RepID=UPI001B88E402|nr:uncharacterized protein LOC121385480 [Gigantopelta aegis]